VVTVHLLGAEQSGFIADLGYETYQKNLAEAVPRIKRRRISGFVC
jgi:transcription-repair coupling factor (superfamily II helicase)